jgi:hypothetical protein
MGRTGFEMPSDAEYAEFGALMAYGALVLGPILIVLSFLLRLDVI